MPSDAAGTGDLPPAGAAAMSASRAFVSDGASEGAQARTIACVDQPANLWARKAHTRTLKLVGIVPAQSRPLGVYSRQIDSCARDFGIYRLIVVLSMRMGCDVGCPAEAASPQARSPFSDWFRLGRSSGTQRPSTRRATGREQQQREATRGRPPEQHVASRSERVPRSAPPPPRRHRSRAQPQRKN